MKNNSQKYICKAVTRWISNKGLKKYQAAIRFGISQSHMGNFLNGQRGISLEQADEIANELEINTWELIREGKKEIEREEKLVENGLKAEYIEAMQALETILLNGGEAAEIFSDVLIKFAENRTKIK